MIGIRFCPVSAARARGIVAGRAKVGRINQGLKRRTCTVRIFPKVYSLLRLITARLEEKSESRETGRIYLNMHPNFLLLAA
jgi:transposase-like protein